MMFWILSITVLIVLIIVSIIFFPGHSAHLIFLEYLNRIITLPFAILTLGLILFFKFKEDISIFLRRPKSITTPWGKYEDLPSQDSAEKIDESDWSRMSEEVFKDRKREDWWIITTTFEKIMRYMFRSQFHLLQMLEWTGKKIAIHDVKVHFYDMEYLKWGGNPTYSFEKYLDFLKLYAGFIKEEGEEKDRTITLIPPGILFLNFCKRMGYTDYEFKPL